MSQLPDIRNIPAVQRAVALYRDRGVTVPFEEELSEYLKSGYVISTPANFVMARTVLLPDGRLALFVCMALGNVAEIARLLLPFRAPWICFYRHFTCDRLRVFPVEQLERRVLRP